MVDGGGGQGHQRALGIALDDERYVIVRAWADKRPVEVVTDEPAVVGLSSDGVLVGSVAARLDASLRAGGFVSALGRAEPFVVGGTPYGAEALLAQVLRSGVDGAARSDEGGETVALASPVAPDDRYRGDLVAEAVRLAAVGEVVLVTVGFGGGPLAAAEAAARSVLAEPERGRRMAGPLGGRLPLIGAGAAATGLGGALAGAGGGGGVATGSSLGDFAAGGDGSSLADFSSVDEGGSSLGDFASGRVDTGGGPAVRDLASGPGAGGSSLADFATDPGPSAMSAPASASKPKWRVPKPAAAALAAATVAVIATVAIIATTSEGDGDAAAPAASTSTAQAPSDPTTTLSATPPVTIDGIPFRFAGTGKRGTSGDGGPALDAELFVPIDVAVGADGRVYIVDRNGPVRVVATNGTISTLFDAELSEPSEIAVAPDGTVYVADDSAGRIVRRAPDGAVTMVMGSKDGNFAKEGDLATGAKLGTGGIDIAVDPEGNLVVTDGSTRNLYRIVAGRVRILMGAGQNRGDPDGQLATEAYVDDSLRPDKVDVSPTGDIVIASRSAVWRIGTADGQLRRLAGIPARRAQEEETGGAADPARETPISMRDIAVRDDGSVLIAEIEPYQIRVVGTDGVLRPFATSTMPRPPSFRPDGIAVGLDGEVFLANGTQGDAVVQKLPPAGSVG